MSEMFPKVPFNERKAAEAASFLVSRSGGRLGRWRLIKLMYMAERRTWERLGRPMFGGTYCSMDYGPVTSEVYDLIKGSQAWLGGEIWNEHFRSVGMKVCLRKEARPARLTRGEIEVLHSVFNEFNRLTKEALGAYMHSLPEYRPVTAARRQSIIGVVDLLKKLGKPREAITGAAMRIRDAAEVEEELSPLRAGPR